MNILKKPLKLGLLPYEPTGEDELHEIGKEQVLGNAKKVLYTDTDSRPWQPTGELQKRQDMDKFSCVPFSGNNCLETDLNHYKQMVKVGTADEEQKGIVEVCEYYKLYNENGEADFSDRNGAVYSGVNPDSGGTTLKKFWDGVRHYGLLPEKDWPYVSDIREYFKTLPSNLIARSAEVMEYLDINYEFVDTYHQFDAMKYGSVQTTIHAYNGMKNGRYVRTLNTINHAIKRAYTKPSVEHYLFDSYEPFEKRMDWNFNFSWGVLPTIHLKKPFKNEYEKLLENGTKYIVRAEAHGEFYKVTPNGFEYLPKDKIKETISQETDLNKDLVELTEQKKILWVNENWFLSIDKGADVPKL